VLIAQVTDTHIVDPDLGTGPHVDHVARLREVVQRINAEDPPVDLVLLTGDLVDLGTEAENRLLCQLLDDLRPPVVGVPGNHDRRETFPTRLLPDGATALGHLSWVLDAGPVRIVGLDSVDPGRPGGVLDEQRTEWLAEVLADEPRRPTMLAVHHPPFDTGIEWMDRSGHPGGRLRPLLAQHRQVERVVCGHLHRPIETRFEHAVVTVAPPTVHAVALDLAERSRPRLVVDPAGYQLHGYRQRDGLWVSHTRYIATGHQPFVPDWA
jgi:3',5'-cyclic-AMP phosphodiesterase